MKNNATGNDLNFDFIPNYQKDLCFVQSDVFPQLILGEYFNFVIKKTKKNARFISCYFICVNLKNYIHHSKPFT